MLSGRTVTVTRYENGYDDERDPIKVPTSERVENVLVAPGATSDIAETTRPDGTKVAFTLAFPKPYAASLRGCDVAIDGEDGVYKVIGDPRPVRDNCPTAWWLTAEVEASNG